MPQAQSFMSWNITCHSAEEAQLLQRSLVSDIDLDRVMMDTTSVASDGSQCVQRVPYRLGDYFAAIRILPDLDVNSASFRLVFHKRADAGRFWKDLMVNLVQEIEASPHTILVAFDCKGETMPAERDRAVTEA
jgi:hypothetical protein